MNKKKIIALISKVIEEKKLGITSRAFINTCRPASIKDLEILRQRTEENKEKSVKSYKDDLGLWHFITQ